jgi:hypothetical protein
MRATGALHFFHAGDAHPCPLFYGFALTVPTRIEPNSGNPISTAVTSFQASMSAFGTDSLLWTLLRT